MAKRAAPAPKASEIQPDELVAMYRRMLAVRRFEEAVVDLYNRSEIPGITHVSIGQEAVAVGVCAALRRDDYITSHHRGHGHCLAKGATVDRMFAELLGKVDGYCRGKGGSMHIADGTTGHLGANAIIGAGTAIATGAALSAQMRGTDQVAVCFIGDGALNQGLFFESLNLAAIWSLPIVFVCENNQYAEYSPTAAMTAGDLVSRGSAFEVPSYTADGNDVVGARVLTEEAVSRGRTGDGPSFIVFQTYRYLGHGMSDVNRPYRTREEEQEWREQRDPIDRHRQFLLDHGHAAEDQLEVIIGEVNAEIERGVQFARSSAAPDAAEVTQHVFS